MEEDEMNDKEEKELALSKIVLVLLIIIGLLAIVWFGWLNT